jgi:hypothetical protein
MTTKSTTSELFPKSKQLSIREEKITPQNIKALSWKQPYAYLMLPPHNKIETRKWDTPWRGLVLICASKVPYTYEETGAVSGYRQNSIYDIVKDLTLITGHAIAIGRLDDTGFMERDDEEQCFVQYRNGLRNYPLRHSI